MTHKTLSTADEMLRDRVMEELEWEPDVDASQIGVGAKDGVVALSGFVETYAGKLAAERAAKQAFGVLGVANDLQVKLLCDRTDPDITRDAVRAVAGLPFASDILKITVRNGHVILEGPVDWQSQKSAAEFAVRQVEGVKDVSNKIRVAPPVSVADVKTGIESALRRSAEIDARRITIAADAGVVTLRGAVHSSLEKDEAESAALAVRGVVEVHSHLKVVP